MGIRLKYCAAVLAVGLLSQSAHAGVVWATNGHEYQVFASEGVTWTNARVAAQALGAGWDLASVTSAGENAFVVALLPGGLADRSHFWIGGTDAAVENTFEWVNGDTFSYTNWWGGEPNNSTAFGPEDFVAYDLHGTGWAWNDAPDALGANYGFARGYIAERRAVPEPGTLALVALGLFGAAIGAGRLRRG
jgi:hypothetical protein